jgi:SAM-dependent methyltransferase
LSASSDLGTAAYFDTETPEYSPDRLLRALEQVAPLVRPAPRLLEVGCGTGGLLALARERLGASRAVGLDVSERSLALMSARDGGCVGEHGSILDGELVARIGGLFDVVLVPAVLHHLVGSTRRASRRLAARGLRNALALAADGGLVVVVEPVFEPRLAMDAVFWIKRAVTAVHAGRVGVFGRWNNVGAPVVSYLGHAELLALARAVSGAEVVSESLEPRAVSRTMRACGISSRGESTVVLRRALPSGRFS